MYICDHNEFMPTICIHIEKMIKITKSFKTEVCAYNYIAVYYMMKILFL